MKNKLQVDIPIWYRPFTCFMPHFYRDVPEYECGYNFEIRVDIITHSWVYPIRYGKALGNYNDNHTAYLKVRWAALWKDFKHCLEDVGIQWVIKRKTDDKTCDD